MANKKGGVTDVTLMSDTPAEESTPEESAPVRKFVQGGGVHPELPGLFLGDGTFEIEQQSDGSWNLVLDESGATASVAELRGESSPVADEATEESAEVVSAPEEVSAPASVESAPDSPPEASAEPATAEPAPESLPDAPSSDSGDAALALPQE